MSYLTVMIWQGYHSSDRDFQTGFLFEVARKLMQEEFIKEGRSMFGLNVAASKGSVFHELTSSMARWLTDHKMDLKTVRAKSVVLKELLFSEQELDPVTAFTGLFVATPQNSEEYNM
ncbi:unnamed protein product [marine sediment metagenome]|uniref:Uncharacterized protein n=1 Tax=marine sediment metagenome TaxID=412755 RepID=X0ZHJ4_9ZZZZ